MNLFTIGHSNMSIESFVSLLRHYDIDTLADIRSYPGSRRCPQFNSESMSGYLRSHGIGYVHIPKLGGRRPKQKFVDASVNDGWENDSFKNYADYTLSQDYDDGLRRLLTIASDRNVAYMCAERHPCQCHRLLVSNTLSARGHDVYHILSETQLQKHKLGIWGAPVHVDDGIVTYPSDKPMQTVLGL